MEYRSRVGKMEPNGTDKKWGGWKRHRIGRMELSHCGEDGLDTGGENEVDTVHGEDGVDTGWRECD